MCFAFIGISGTKQIEKTLRDLQVTTEALWQLGVEREKERLDVSLMVGL
jgi:hypothetical protein